MHDNDFGRAIMFLEMLGNKPEAEGMWNNLATIAINENELKIAERCYAALGDIARTHFIKETLDIAEKYAEENGNEAIYFIL